MNFWKPVGCGCCWGLFGGGWAVFIWGDWVIGRWGKFWALFWNWAWVEPVGVGAAAM